PSSHVAVICSRPATSRYSPNPPRLIASRYLDFHGLDVPYATSSTFKYIKLGPLPKSRPYSSEPHNFSAACATRRYWREFIRVFVVHGRKRFLNRNVVRSRSAAALAHRCGNGELTNKQKNDIAFVFLVTTVTRTI